MPEQLDENGNPIATPPVPPAQPSGKVWTDDYVQHLREEAKENRIARKAAEAKLRALIGLKDDEDIDDAKITAYQTTQSALVTAALEKANARLITAAIKGLEGYDSKLVDRLIDKSKLTITDAGEVEGLTELIKTLETEFPQVKISTHTPGANPPPAASTTETQQMQDAYDAAIKSGNTAMAIAIKNKLFTH